MNSRISKVFLAIVLAFVAIAAARAQSTDVPAPPPPPPPIAPAIPPASVQRGDQIEQRLAALAPERAWEYFELGEELADRSSEPAMRSLARTLFVLAYENSKRRPAPRHSSATGAPAAPQGDIRVSVCLALAALSERDHERRWLRAIASSMGWRSGRSGVDGRRAGADVDPAALDLANAIGLIRTGEGRHAARLLDKPEVAQLLLRSERLLSPAGITGGEARIRRLMSEWPNCPECRNRRFIKNQEGVRLCPTCGGKPGPKLPQQELLYQLRLESSLLHGVQKSWVAQTVVDGGAPLRDLDPDELAKTFGVDPAKPLWRNGGWTALPGGAATAAPATSPSPAAQIPSPPQ